MTRTFVKRVLAGALAAGLVVAFVFDFAPAPREPDVPTTSIPPAVSSTRPEAPPVGPTVPG